MTKKVDDIANMLFEDVGGGKVGTLSTEACIVYGTYFGYVF